MLGLSTGEFLARPRLGCFFGLLGKSLHEIWLDPVDGHERVLSDSDQEAFEELKGFTLVFLERISLAIATQSNAIAQMV